MAINKYGVDLTTDASGNASVKTNPINGRILDVLYTPDASVPFTNTATVTITGTQTTRPILTKATIGTVFSVLSPREPLHAVADGSALTYDGTHAATDYVALAGEQATIAISGGGNTKKGHYDIVVDEGGR